MLGKHKVAVITGASRGIGARLVRGFREIGYGVVVNSRSMSASEAGGDQMILAVDGDVASPDTAERIVSGAMQRFGRIDTLVNNARVFIPKPFVAERRWGPPISCVLKQQHPNCIATLCDMREPIPQC
jgi:NAD(P)-dependent dehydrogenase (short-subunit alcohol dehydrogenase family)